MTTFKATTSALVGLVLVLVMQARPATENRSGAYLDQARDVARWIRASAIKVGEGLTWPADPADAKTTSLTLYAGSPGIILFFLEANRATGDRQLLSDARAGADHLLSVLREEKQCGLYEGLSGIGYALIETFKSTGEARYREGGRECFELIRRRASKVGRGVEWSDVTDIIAGSAGIGLTLLYAARELNEPAYRQLAVEAGRRLIELGQEEAGGLKWAMSPSFNRLMPNFSHGTAGIAYFLATLYQETRDKLFLDAAIAGARYLQAIARTEGDVCLIFHNEPEGKELFYLGWCHGPAGSARLFLSALSSYRRADMDDVGRTIRKGDHIERHSGKANARILEQRESMLWLGRRCRVLSRSFQGDSPA